MQVHLLPAATPELRQIIALRSRLDPERSGRYPLHITIAYAPTQTLGRVEAPLAVPWAHLRGVCQWPAPDQGIYIDVEDRSGWIAKVRKDLGENTSCPYIPHVTLLHHSVADSVADLDALHQHFADSKTPTDVEIARLIRYDDRGNAIEERDLGLA